MIKSPAIPPLLMLLVLGLSSCEQPGAGPPGGNAGPPAVTVAAVAERDVSEVFEDVGRTEAVAQVDVRAQVTGILRTRAFTEGGDVKKGDPLFEIEPAQFEADEAVQEAAVASARATNNKAAKYLARLQGMRKGTVSAVDMETADAEAAEAKAKLQQAEAQLQLAKLDLGYTKIASPISGRIGESSIDVGNLVTADSEALVTIVQLDPIYVAWSVSERLITTVKSELRAQGLPLDISARVVPRLRLSNGVEYPLDGKVVFEDNQVNPRTGTVALRAEFPNPDELLIPGQFVTTLIRLNATESHQLIPQSAVQQDMAGYFVLVVDSDNVVAQRRVTLGNKIGAEWIVSDGLTNGELVIYQGLEKVKDGATVAPTVEKPAAEAGTPSVKPDAAARQTQDD